MELLHSSISIHITPNLFTRLIIQLDKGDKWKMGAGVSLSLSRHGSPVGGILVVSVPFSREHGFSGRSNMPYFCAGACSSMWTVEDVGSTHRADLLETALSGFHIPDRASADPGWLVFIVWLVGPSHGQSRVELGTGLTTRVRFGSLKRGDQRSIPKKGRFAPHSRMQNPSMKIVSEKSGVPNPKALMQVFPLPCPQKELPAVVPAPLMLVVQRSATITTTPYLPTLVFPMPSVHQLPIPAPYPQIGLRMVYDSDRFWDLSLWFWVSKADPMLPWVS